VVVAVSRVRRKASITFLTKFEERRRGFDEGEGEGRREEEVLKDEGEEKAGVSF